MASRSNMTLLMYCLTNLLPWTIVLTVISVTAGYIINANRIDPLTTDLPKAILLPESGAELTLINKAYSLFQQGEVVFVDARAEEDFIEGHIDGAYSLSYERFDELYDALLDWTGGQPILVYGTVNEFPVADDLAYKLIKSGEETVYLFSTGIEAWREREMPIQSGEDGLLTEDAWGDDDWGDDWENDLDETGSDPAGTDSGSQEVKND